MLEKLHRIALALTPLQGVCLLAIAVMCIIVALSVFQISVFAGDAFLIPAFVGLLWFLSLYSFIACFRSLPAKSDPEARRLTRLRSSLARAFYWLIAGLLLCISVAVILVSIRFLRIYGA